MATWLGLLFFFFPQRNFQYGKWTEVTLNARRLDNRQFSDLAKQVFRLKLDFEDEEQEVETQEEFLGKLKFLVQQMLAHFLGAWGKTR